MRAVILLRSITALLALVVGLSATVSLAQIGGIEVSPEGVLKLRRHADPTGKLTRQRMEQAKAVLNADIVDRSELRKVSLNRLEAAVAKHLKDHAGLPPEMKYLAGLTRIEYVFFYPETGDIVVAGPAEGFMPDLSGRVVGMHSGDAVIELQDLIVALRAYAPGVEGPRTISVSIDPTKEGLQRLQQYLAQVGGRATPRDTLALVNGMKNSLGPQNVTLKGVSPKTHFAQVLVEADYRMKLIGIGLEKPDVKITTYVDRARPASVARNAMQRWYFTPNYERVKVSKDNLAMQLVGHGVKLVGRDELVKGDGQRVGVRNVDRASQMFTESFTRNYPEIANKTPVFAQLRNLIDISVVAAFIQQQDFYGQADWKMETFADNNLLPVDTLNAPVTVDTAVNAIWKGSTLMTPIGGGVNIQPAIALRESNLKFEEAGEITAKAEDIGIKAIPADRWWWD